jgi:hypothetical protein
MKSVGRSPLRFYLALMALLGAILFPVEARAEWHQVSTNHFVIYGDSSEKKLRRFSEQLERFHGAMALVTGQTRDLPSPSNRVTIYLVGSMGEVRKLHGGGAASRYIGGFYRPQAGRTVAVVPRVTDDSDDLFTPGMSILLHEYAHHFLISANSFPTPRWVSEGAAEFFASASFEKDGAVFLGRPNTRRSVELHFARDVTVTDLLDPEAYERRRGKSSSYDAFYGKSWLLYHYLSLGDQRKGQLRTYFRGLIEGKSSPAAASAAFGDLKVLEKELDTYLKRPRLTSIVVKAAALSPGPVSLRRLSAGEAAIMPVLVRSWSGVNAEQAAQVVLEARQVAAQFPGDGAVQAALAEAEFDAGNDVEAVAAADAALKLDRTLVNGYVQKGYALFRIAERGTDPKAFRTARSVWVELNRLENNHPLPLIYFFRSYGSQGQEPTALAVQGLIRAAELAPFDLGLRLTLAQQLLRDGRRDEARSNLVPLAYNPHGGKLAEFARGMIERIEREPDWRGEGSVVPDKEEEEEAASSSLRERRGSFSRVAF